MKHILLLALMICNIAVYSQQPDPLFYQTWYLNRIQTDDLAPIINVFAIEPAVSPTLIISDNMSFTGTGVCNSFSGLFTDFEAGGLFQTTQFTATSLVCDTEINNILDAAFRNFMQTPTQYFLAPDGVSLMLINPLMGYAEFLNYPLGNTDFDSEQIAIYPNPASTSLHLNLKSLRVSKIDIVNTVGQKVKVINNDFESINIADLSSGIYVLKISTEFGIIHRKFLKE